MDTTSLSGGFADASRGAAHAFRALLKVMAQPGQIEPLQGSAGPAPISPAAATLLLTLCDQTTGLFLAPSHDTPALRDWITFHIGAPFVASNEAMFALGTWTALAPVERFPIGTPEYPDRSATLIVEVEDLSMKGATLTGPGIKETAQLSLPETDVFRANRARFPLGFDCYFTCANRVAGLPRSTHVLEG